jgi:hypothetical protein
MGRPKGSKNKPKVQSPSLISTPQGDMTVAEVVHNIETYEQKQDRLKEIFAKTSKALQLTDLTKTESRTYTAYSRDTLRTYLKSPKAYEQQLRNVSRYLARMSYEYRRMLVHYATMICGDAFSITPNYDLTQDVSDEDILNNYFETLTRWQRIQFESELIKLLLVAWREDAVYAYIYDDTDQEGGTFYAHILDGDYCRISSITNGIPKFAFDFTYFRKYPQDLEYWDSEFKKKYNKYQSDNNLRWQELEPSREICFKVGIDDPKMDYPPLAALFEHLINLLDLQGIQNVKDTLSIYKLLVARLKPLTGTDEPDDFEVDPETAVKYFNKMLNYLPPEVAAILSPLPIDPIEFNDKNTTQDSDMIAMSSKNLFNSVGGAILGTEYKGSTIYEAKIIEDMEYAQSTLLPQVNKWIDQYFNHIIGTHHATIKYIDGVCPYTRKTKRKELLESAQNGLGNALDIAILDGSSHQETLSRLRLNQALGINSLLIPLSNSYTQSGNTKDTDPINGGAPVKDATELTDEGSRSREEK